MGRKGRDAARRVFGADCVFVDGEDRAMREGADDRPQVRPVLPEGVLLVYVALPMPCTSRGQNPFEHGLRCAHMPRCKPTVAQPSPGRRRRRNCALKLPVVQ